jgi:dolichol-phosphate mannosyltransferase
MKLSVIIPVFNEKGTISELLGKVKSVDVEKEIVIVDDGSTDGTRGILEAVAGCRMPDAGKNEIKIIYHEKNQGKGVAIRTGLKNITGDIVIIQDADLEYDPQDYPKLIEPILSGKAKAVYGSRILGKGRRSYWSFYIGGKFLSFLTNLLYDAKITDEPTCYKVFQADVIKNINLKCSRFEFCPEVTAKLRKKGYKIYEVPISYEPRSLEEGKKINWKDGFEAIWTLIKYKFIA